jgi:integrase
VRTGFLEDSEYRAIMRELPEHLRPLIAFAYYTGCRRGELLKLKWQSVDLIDGVVRLEAGTTKNKEARMIPLNPELVELLAMRKAKRDSEFPSCGAVFFGAKGEPIRDFKDGWRYACYRAGLWQGDDFKTGRPTRIFHDLRRTGVRNNVRAGVPEKVAQEISGHKTRAVFERYNIVNERDLKEAARRQYEYIQQQRAAAQSCTKVAPSGDSAGSLAVQ